MPSSDAPRGPWRLWCYAVEPGWEETGSHATREATRDDRAELIECDGYPPDWVAVRRAEQGPPEHQPSQASIGAVLAADAEDAP